MNAMEIVAILSFSLSVLKWGHSIYKERQLKKTKEMLVESIESVKDLSQKNSENLSIYQSKMKQSNSANINGKESVNAVGTGNFIDNSTNIMILGKEAEKMFKQRETSTETPQKD